MANFTPIPVSIDLPAPSGDWEADTLTRALIQRTGGRLAIPTREAMAILGQADTVGAAQRRRERGTLPFAEREFGQDGRKYVTVTELVRVLLGRDPAGASPVAPSTPTPPRRGRPPMVAPVQQGREARHE